MSRLFVLTLANGRVEGEPVDLSGTLDADVPSKPFGDGSDYTFSPDSSKVVFATKLKGSQEAWSTNFDLYEVSVDGGAARNLTQDNPAWDTQPVFSPDGTQLAWRAMKRAGFEADRFHVVIADLKTGERRALTDAWDRSVDSIAFARDGKTLYATADHFGQHPLWAIDVKTGKATMLSGPGHVDAFSVGEREIVFARASLKSPAEMYSLALKGGELRELPRMNADALAAINFGEPEQFTFAGANGENVYAYVVKPANFDPASAIPSPSSFTAARNRRSATLGAIAGIHRRTQARVMQACLSTSTARPVTAKHSRIRSAAIGAASRSKTCRKAWPQRSKNTRGSMATARARSARPTAAT